MEYEHTYIIEQDASEPLLFNLINPLPSHQPDPLLAALYALGEKGIADKIGIQVEIWKPIFRGAATKMLFMSGLGEWITDNTPTCIADPVGVFPGRGPMTLRFASKADAMKFKMTWC